MPKLNRASGLCLGLAFLAMPLPGKGLLETPAARAANAEQSPSSYSPILRFLAETKLDSLKEDLRLPTERELKELDPLWPKVPLEENAAFYYEEVVRLLNWLSEPAGSLSGTEPYAGDMKAFKHWIETNQASLDLTRKAQTVAVCHFPVLIDSKTGMPKDSRSLSMHLKLLLRTVCDSGFLEELKGNPDAAAEWYLSCMRIGTQMRQHAALGSLHWAYLSAIGSGCRFLPAVIANTPLTEETLRRVIRDSHAAEVAQDDIRNMLRLEQAFETQSIAHVRDQETWTTYLRGRVTESGAKEPPIPEDFARCKDMVGKLCGFLLRFWDRPVEKLVEDETQFDKLLPSELKEYEPLGNDIQVYRALPARWAVVNGELRSLQIRAGITLYQKSHNGTLPESLDALCPDILSKVPIDPFSGKPMRYARTEEDGWKVWSVGFNRIDDGGVGAGQGWRGLDCVFTSAVQSNIEARSRKAMLGAGETAPSFEVKTLEGKTIKLSDYRGKYVLLDFWATWCSICLGETPGLKSTHDAFDKDDRFVMIGLSLDDKVELPREYVAKQGLNWIQCLLGDDWSLPKQYGVWGIPAVFLVGPDGKVVAGRLHGDGIKAAVAEALRRGN